MKKALITGANSLVNKVLLEKLIEMGYEVLAHYHSENEITFEIRQNFPNVEFIQADFSEDTSVKAFISKCIAEGPYDVVVNGAVTYNAAKDGWEERQKDLEVWMQDLSINLAVPGVIMANGDVLLNKGGVIINISSAIGLTNFGEKQFVVYGATKAGLDSLTATYAKRWAPDVRVVGIAPAYVRSAWNKDLDEKENEELLKAHLTRKYVEPQEIANLMEAVINNPSITATTILIDGGYSAPVI